MSSSGPPDPVKVFVAALWSRAADLGRARRELVERLGEIDREGPDHPFDVTDYYREEMGEALRRRLISFVRLVPPDQLPDLKLATHRVEQALRLPGGGRTVNLDVGYLDHHKVVLASVKEAGQKIYLRDGIWADIMFRYSGGRLVPFDWTFPDFRDGRYETELLDMRARYLARIRGRGRDRISR